MQNLKKKISFFGEKRRNWNELFRWCDDLVVVDTTFVGNRGFDWDETVFSTERDWSWDGW